MPTFDIVSEIDHQKFDNAVNATIKDFTTRFDFNGSKTRLEFDKKAMTLQLTTENEMRVKAIQDILISRVMKQGLEASCLDFGKEHRASGNMIQKEIKVKQGIDKESAKIIVKSIKDSGLKVQASIMDEQIRVTAKKIDDLQATISKVKGISIDLPLQYINFRS
jgi:hypothetical protein